MTEKSTSDRLLDAIAVALLQITRTGRDHFYLYAEVVPGVIAPTLYQVFVDRLAYVLLPNPVVDLIHDLWLDREADEPWQAMRFELIGGWYQAHFDRFDIPAFLDPAYEGEIDEEDTAAATEQERHRLHRAITSRFGALPISYPSVDDGGYAAQVTFKNM